MIDNIWVINTNAKDFDKIDMDLNKHIILKSNRPVPLPRRIAMKYIGKAGIKACENPEKYFENKNLNRLVIRDAGIGDLLLLEPILRQLSKDGNDITIMTRFPEVYENNPYIKETIQMGNKAEFPKGVKVESYDISTDLRSYSETCEKRDIDHRTDCYNQQFNINIEDKQPQIYFSRKEEKRILKKDDSKNYIGIACDGSHFFRRYAYGVELIEYILKQDKNNIVVIIGDGWEDGQGYIKFNRKDKRVMDLQGKTNIRQCINIIKDLDYLISVDTGLMHIGLTLNIPTVCIFSIIDPKLRIEYYTGEKAIIYKKDMSCIGCGSWHMAKCIHGDIRKDRNFIPPCMEITPEKIYDKMMSMNKNDNPRIFYGEGKVEKKIYFNFIPDNKLVMPIIVLNEEKNLPRFIDLVMKHPAIGRTIAIDGGSSDNTVSLLKKAGAKVYMHYYDKDYHDMQALQRNISFSFIRDGEKCIMMDIDECFSRELSDYLGMFVEDTIQYGLLSRRTYDYYEDINNPTKQIKDYPDWQPRLFTWNRKFKWVGSPHHMLYNAPNPVQIKKDIIHFEKEGKDRDALEAKWAKMQKATQEIYL